MGRVNIARLLIGVVTTINIQSAVSFFLKPERYAPAFELFAIPGQAAIQGFGVLFLMWSVPYLFAFVHPLKFRVSLYEAISMQMIGFIGEIIIALGIPIQFVSLHQSIQRFIYFDASGLVALVISVLLIKNLSHKHHN